MVKASVMDFCIPFWKSLILIGFLDKGAVAPLNNYYSLCYIYREAALWNGFFSGASSFFGAALWVGAVVWVGCCFLFKKLRTSSFMILPSFPVPTSWLMSILCSLHMALTAGVASFFSPETLIVCWVSACFGLAVSLLWSSVWAPALETVVLAPSSTSISRRTSPTWQASSSLKYLLWIFPLSEAGIWVNNLSVATSARGWY